jgi:hypothetical protein
MEILFGMVVFMVGAAVLWAAIRLIQVTVDRRRRERRLQNHPYDMVFQDLPPLPYGELPPGPPEDVGILPPRVADVTLHVRIEPDPMDYRKARRIIDGLNEGPYNSVDLEELSDGRTRSVI